MQFRSVASVLRSRISIIQPRIIIVVIIIIVWPHRGKPFTPWRTPTRLYEWLMDKSEQITDATASSSLYQINRRGKWQTGNFLFTQLYLYICTNKTCIEAKSYKCHRQWDERWNITDIYIPERIHMNSQRGSI